MAYLGNAPVVGDSTNSFKLLDDIASFTLTFDATDTSVVSISGDTLSFTNHRFVTGQKVTYTDGGGTAIGGLTDETSYFIIKVDQNTIKLATNASNAASSTAINLTSGAAGGSHTLKVAFDGVNTKFKATFNNGKKAKISRAAQISLSINGVIQQPQDSSSPSVGYGVEADSTIVFSTAPAATDKVFASFIGEVAASFDITDNTIDNFTGDGSTTLFNLSKEVPSSQDVLVTLDGVTQHPSDASTTRSYSIVNQALTFVSAPATGVAIQARHIGFAGATTSAVTGFYGRTGNTALTSTDDISVQNISGVGATFTSNVNIEGVLTYEDVTNVDSIGIITARAGVLVGSGITLSKDGDVFFTGIATGNGSGLTALNASNISSGTVPTARLGSGTASSSTFLRGDSTFQTVNTDLVSDTSPQLGGNLDVNTKNIVFGDSGSASDDRLTFGAGTDLSIYHGGDQNYVSVTGTGNLNLTSGGAVVTKVNSSEDAIVCNANGSVDLYYDNSKKFETTSTGVTVSGNANFANNNKAIFGTGNDAEIYHNDTDFHIDAQGSGATRGVYITAGTVSSPFITLRTNDGEDMLKCLPDDGVYLYHNGNLKLRTTSAGTELRGDVHFDNHTNTGNDIYWDESNDRLSFNDNVHATFGNGEDLRIFHDGSNNYIKGTGDHGLIFATNNSNKAFFRSNGNFVPWANNSYDIGESGLRWANVYTNDLHLSNKGSTNSIDNTWGDYTIQEGESDLFLINNRSGKKYKFNLTEVS